MNIKKKQKNKSTKRHQKRTQIENKEKRKRIHSTHEIEHDDEHEVDEGGGDGGGQLGVASDEVGVRLVDREADRYPVDDHAEDRSQHHEQLTNGKRVVSIFGRDVFRVICPEAKCESIVWRYF